MENFTIVVKAGESFVDCKTQIAPIATSFVSELEAIGVFVVTANEDQFKELAILPCVDSIVMLEGGSPQAMTRRAKGGVSAQQAKPTEPHIRGILMRN